MRDRKKSAKKAVETRRKRNPNWGKYSSVNVCWKDNGGFHEKLAIHCGEHGLRINDVYSKLIEMYLDNPDIID